MKTVLKIHQKWAESLAVPQVLKAKIISSTETEHSVIQREYQSQRGECGMNNVSLDICWWVSDEQAHYIEQAWKRIGIPYQTQ